MGPRPGTGQCGLTLFPRPVSVNAISPWRPPGCIPFSRFDLCAIAGWHSPNSGIRFWGGLLFRSSKEWVCSSHPLRRCRNLTIYGCRFDVSTRSQSNSLPSPMLPSSLRPDRLHLPLNLRSLPRPPLALQIIKILQVQSGAAPFAFKGAGFDFSAPNQPNTLPNPGLPVPPRFSNGLFFFFRLLLTLP